MLIKEVYRQMAEDGDYKGYYYRPFAGARMLRVRRQAQADKYEEQGWRADG